MARSAGLHEATLWFLAVIVTAVAAVACASLFQFWLFLRLPGHAAIERRQVTIPPGMGAAGVARILHAEGVVSDPDAFYLLCRLQKAGHKLRAGEYAFPTLSAPGQILDQIVSGKAILHRLTFPEGSTVRDVARILEERGLVSEKAVLRLSEDKDFLKDLNVDGSNLEGYLFPETYLFQRTQDEAAMLKMMVRQFWRHFPDAWRDRISQTGLTVHEVVILASLVEKEAKVDAERPVIAAVFLNRLDRNMPLQSDPSAVYDLAGFSGAVTSVHLKRQSPYNTYLNKGLPPGPICNPGAKSLKAALFPDRVSYLYFVSNNDGTHRFSETLAEHQQAVSDYREKRKAASEKEGRSVQ